MTFEAKKKEIISIANELILQGYELSELANNEKLINTKFRLRRLTTIITVLQVLKEEWNRNHK